jgi:PmbA protein
MTLDPKTAVTLLEQALAAARQAGADAADAVLIAEASQSISWRMGALEDVSRSEGQDLGLRVFVGQSHATVSSSDFTAAALGRMAERAVAMARLAPADPYAGLAAPDALMTGDLPVLDLDDGGEVPTAQLREQAAAAEAAALAVKGVSNSEGAGASAGRSLVALATSNGFARSYTTSSHSLSASVVAARDGAMERDYAYHSVRHAADLDAAEVIGREAGERAVARVGATKLATQTLPVIFEPRVAASLLGHFLGAISGAAIARQSSFLLGKLGTRIFAPGVTIHDDPRRPRGLRSRPFDGEGMAALPLTLVDDGVLTTWLLDGASARQLGLAAHGRASRGVSSAPSPSPTNVWIAPGNRTPDEMVKSLTRGVYVTELIGMGVNGVTGDYSRGASGFLIENGERTVPVSEITLGGTLLDMFARLEPASDLAFRYGTNAPTLLIDGMTVAGT